MNRLRTLHSLAALMAGCLLASPAAAITVKIDYTYDTNGFFGSGNPQGATAGNQARAALESAAGFFSNILNDTFSLIQTPPNYVGELDTQIWEWTMNFDHPATNAPVELVNPTVPSDQYIIYAGARNLSGTTAGIGGPGGYGYSSRSLNEVGFYPDELAEIEVIQEQFVDAVESRGEPNGFAAWGGAITFDRDNSTPWHFNRTTQPSGNVRDFLSVALHELGHALGFGASDEFQELISGGNFDGTSAKSEYGGPVPLAGGGHWAFGTSSTIYGTAATQETAMDPDITNGTRKLFTDLDAAALEDIGWEVIPLPRLAGDYNGNGTVDAADYALWRNTRGQNVAPGSGADGSGNGNIGNEDYTYWRRRFGNAGFGAGGGAVSESFAGAVPEPGSGAMAMLFCLTAVCVRKRASLFP